MFNFYKCDVSYAVDHKLNRTGYVVGDFVYYDLEVYFGIKYDGTFDVEVNG